ncbi:MAG: lipase family protein, partial [Candidatus Corynebacterium faecigallinarum]
DVLTNSHYRLGTRALNAPMLVLNAAHDDTIPYDQSREMAASYCALGGSDGAHAPVQFITDPMPEIAPKTAANHAVPMFSQAGTAFSWIVDRFNGVAAPNSCGSL